MTDADARLLRKLQRRLESEEGRAHAFTREFFRQLRKNRLMPVQSQVPVGSEQHRIGTMVDVVVTPSTHVARTRSHNSYVLRTGAQVFLLEIKCGFQRTYRRHTGMFMKYPPRWVDAPQAQHQLQLAVTCDLFERTFQTPVAGSFVVRLFEVRAIAAAATATDCSMGAQGGAKWYPLEDIDPSIMRTLLRRLFDRATRPFAANERECT
jgi:hypothetical protein